MYAKVPKRLQKISELKFANHENELVKFCDLGLEYASQALYPWRDAAKAKELEKIPTKLHEIGEPVCSIYLETIEEHIVLKLEVETDSISNFQPILEINMSIELLDMVHVSSIKNEFGLLDLEAWILAIPSEFPRMIEKQGLWPLLRRLIMEYHEKLNLFYEPDPISPSQAALYTLELLVRKSAGDMERLSQIEDYVQKRNDLAKYGFQYACSNFGHAEDLSVKLFDSGFKFGKLPLEIQAHDGRKWEEKTDELKQAKEEELDSVSGQELSLDCVALKTAEELGIEVSERMLPSGEDRQKAVVVKLLLTSWMNAWRDSTLFLHLDLFKGILQKAGTHAWVYLELESYQALTTNGVSISGTIVEDILVENGLQWKYWQALPFLESYVPTEEMDYPIEKLKIFQLKMPPAPTVLDYFSFRAGHSAGPSPNEVISKQW
ncbi:hypothetical protein Cpir12675_003402 [Ceratocystis pirilliformis]|uniref:Uncharacterized protein n=1 Tax=Ceratocystis pirilliformis TaxID=259994 RepID=A0ABR3Z489_9PEZI